MDEKYDGFDPAELKIKEKFIQKGQEITGNEFVDELMRDLATNHPMYTIHVVFIAPPQATHFKNPKLGYRVVRCIEGKEVSVMVDMTQTPVRVKSKNDEIVINVNSSQECRNAINTIFDKATVRILTNLIIEYRHEIRGFEDRIKLIKEKNGGDKSVA